jgi:Sulfotransferase domain
MSLRIAVISTPRTGSTWLRLLLTEAYGIPGFAVHRPDELNWADLPEECVVNLHWHRTPALVHRLREKGFRVVCCRRHPLDILISILQLGWHDDSSLQWLDGEGGGERPIHGVMPGSAAFLDYGAGPRAAALMTVSREWTAAPECLRVRYEDLVADAKGELQRIVEALGEPTRRPIAEVVGGATIPKLRDRTKVACHFWQGRPGLWRSLLIGPAVERLAEVHHAYCAELGYSCAADPQLVAAQADANWLALTWPQVAEKLRAYRPLRQELAEAQDKLGRLGGEYAANRRGNETLARSNEELAKGNAELGKGYQELLDYCRLVERAYKEMQAILQATGKVHVEAKQVEQERPRGLGPASLAVARWLNGLSHRLPGPASAVKRLLHLNQLKKTIAEKAG